MAKYNVVLVQSTAMGDNPKRDTVGYLLNTPAEASAYGNGMLVGMMSAGNYERYNVGIRHIPSKTAVWTVIEEADESWMSWENTSYPNPPKVGT